ncbi:hypothetical protein VYU27_008608 [Nannochloropsis oceanica]
MARVAYAPHGQGEERREQAAASSSPAPISIPTLLSASSSSSSTTPSLSFLGGWRRLFTAPTSPRKGTTSPSLLSPVAAAWIKSNNNQDKTTLFSTSTTTTTSSSSSFFNSSPLIETVHNSVSSSLSSLAMDVQHELQSFLALSDYLTLERSSSLLLESCRPPPSSPFPSPLSSSSYFLHSCLQMWYSNASHLSLPPSLARSLVRRLVASVPPSLEERRKRREEVRERGRKKRNSALNNNYSIYMDDDFDSGKEEGGKREGGGRGAGGGGGGDNTDTESTCSHTPPPPLLLLAHHSPSSSPSSSSLGSSASSSSCTSSSFCLSGRRRVNPYLLDQDEDEDEDETGTEEEAAEKERMSAGIPHPARVRPLLASCVGASSQDREEEGAGNTLKPSVCIATLVHGSKRALHDYFLSLDARPHILNADNFEQISADTFRCEMAPIQFFSASIIPVIDIRLEVDAKAGTAIIHAVSGKIKRSDQPVNLEEARANGYVHTGSGHFDEMSFKMNTINNVRWQQIDEKTIKISSELQMEVSMDKPGWLLVPSSMMNRVGSLILQRVVKKTLPEFLQRIQNGYALWAGGEVVV